MKETQSGEDTMVVMSETIDSDNHREEARQWFQQTVGQLREISLTEKMIRRTILTALRYLGCWLLM